MSGIVRFWLHNRKQIIAASCIAWMSDATCQYFGPDEYNVARNARQILGGMGITAEYPVMRHLINLETLITYQGTDEIHTLITGRNITGVSAF